MGDGAGRGIDGRCREELGGNRRVEARTRNGYNNMSVKGRVITSVGLLAEWQTFTRGNRMQGRIGKYVCVCE